MGFTYLGGENWLDVTREERLFYSYLYWDIKDKEKDFMLWLNENTGLELRADDEWEVGYEVFFYRDLQNLKGVTVRPTKYSPKRTFDLCLFSEDTIVIIEAKAQQGFDKSQVNVFQSDRKDIPEITGNNIKEVKVIALVSSYYRDNYRKYGRHDILSKPYFDALITWKQMGDLYINNRRIYLRANKVYETKSASISNVKSN